MDVRVATDAACGQHRRSSCVRRRRLCYPIAQGDTAARIAERLTGDPRNRRAPWFEIVDERWRLISKADYGSIRPGWLACVASDGPCSPVARQTPVATAGARSRNSRPGSGTRRMRSISRFCSSLPHCSRQCCCCAMERAAPSTAASALCEMQRFGAASCRSSARPHDPFRGATPPPRARLRVSPRRARVEILLAPATAAAIRISPITAAMSNTTWHG